MKFNHIGIPTTENFEGEIRLEHLKMTVSDHLNNPYGVQWMRPIRSWSREYRMLLLKWIPLKKRLEIRKKL